MARIQILELPTVCRANGDDETPFVVVIDQLGDDEASERFHQDIGDGNLAEAIGARQVLAFQDTMDIPANDTSAYVTGTTGDVRLEFQADYPKFGPPAVGELLTDPDRIPGRYA
ncbi:hypothetical protein PV396_24460 [Streptomyces sp. ME02-8801-2C]|uniref:hypothetical protein n=1 Tax=Streptomyces sp. ME02-8801-2C TaxID=3028680 RepID=UPI0029A8C52B|nr:hypothetical protein [Streptomyces sp. ME02-8801-2C]MDX3455055.1 hypothetical protein [Streptomyces sp. ME02-8801-2C]